MLFIKKLNSFNIAYSKHMVEETQTSQNTKSHFQAVESHSNHPQVQEFQLSVDCSLWQSSVSIR